MSTFLPVILSLSLLLVPLSTWATDAPPLSPTETETLCTRLTVKSAQFGAFGFSKQAGTAAAVEDDRLWATYCRSWQLEKDMIQCAASHTCGQPKGFSGGAPVLPSDYRMHTTTHCTTSGHSGPYGSNLSTFCSSY